MYHRSTTVFFSGTRYTRSVLERLQKILSARGIASRRKAEEYLAQGLVRVNGKVAKVGDKADPDTDRIEVDGAVLESRREMLYYVLNKPVGIVTTNVETQERMKDAEEDGEPLQGFEATHAALRRLQDRAAVGRDQTVRDLLPSTLQGKVFPVGRLDKDSEGLLLLTNDGVLAYRLTHPKFDHEKEYVVRTQPALTPGSLRALRDGVKIDGTPTKPARIEPLGPGLFRITLTEGRYRQIRRMCQKVGGTVTSLKRTRIMTLQDDALKPGRMRKLTPPEVKALLESVGVGDAGAANS